MVKHQRRSHQKLIRSEIDDDETSESDSDESLSETQHLTRMMQPGRSPQHLVVLDEPRIQCTGYERHQDEFRCQNKLSYVPEQDNPRVATLNTVISPITQSPHHQLSQNTQSSPSTYSTASIASPAPQRDVYSHVPTRMASHALQTQQLSLIGQQPMVCYQQLPHDPAHLPSWWTGSDCRNGQATSHIYSFADEWEQKIGLFGPLLQMPSARIETL
jgi:hypothetical protein